MGMALCPARCTLLSLPPTQCTYMGEDVAAPNHGVLNFATSLPTRMAQSAAHPPDAGHRPLPFDGSVARISPRKAALVYGRAGGTLMAGFALYLFACTQVARLFSDVWVR